MTTPDKPDPRKALTEEQIKAKAREIFGDSIAPIDVGTGWRAVASALAQFKVAAAETGHFTEDEAVELTHDLLHIIVNDLLEQNRRNKRDKGN